MDITGNLEKYTERGYRANYLLCTHTHTHTQQEFLSMVKSEVGGSEGAEEEEEGMGKTVEV